MSRRERERERTGCARWFANFPYDRSDNLPGAGRIGNRQRQPALPTGAGRPVTQTAGVMKKEIKTFGKQQIQFAGSDYPHLVNIGRSKESLNFKNLERETNLLSCHESNTSRLPVSSLWLF